MFSLKFTALKITSRIIQFFTTTIQASEPEWIETSEDEEDDEDDEDDDESEEEGDGDDESDGTNDDCYNEVPRELICYLFLGYHL